MCNITVYIKEIDIYRERIIYYSYVLMVVYISELGKIEFIYFSYNFQVS